KARKEVARRARREHYPAPYAIIELWERFDGDALAPPAGDAAGIHGVLASPTAANLIRVFHLQERLKTLGKVVVSTMSRVHVIGGETMVGDIAAWCALRALTVTLQHQDAQRLAPAMQRAANLFTERLKHPRRI